MDELYTAMTYPTIKNEMRNGPKFPKINFVESSSKFQEMLF